MPINSPIADPAINGMAIAHFMPPDAIAKKALPVETMVNTPKEVATMDFIGKSVNFFKAGTKMKPPPTPSNPERKPANAPENISDLAQGTVHINFPID